MKQKRCCLLCSYSNPVDFVFASLIKFFLPVTILNTLYFQYQFYRSSKVNCFHEKNYHEDFNLYYSPDISNISIRNFSISIIFIFPDSQNFDEMELFKISLKSWREVFPQAEVFACFNQNGIHFFNIFQSSPSNNDEEFKKIHVFPKVETDELGIIYIDDLFHKIFQNAKTDLVCLIKNNAILPLEIKEKIIFLTSFFHNKNQQFSAIGQRCALKLEPNNTNFKLSRIDSYFKAFIKDDILRNVNIQDNSMYSNDFIFFTLKNNKLNIDDIPSFHYGMDCYDTWIPGWMNEQIPVVSLGDECSSYNIGRYTKIQFHSKLAENFEAARFHGDKFMISSRLKLKIKDRKLINDTVIIAVF